MNPIIIAILFLGISIHCHGQKNDSECNVEYDTIFKMNTIVGGYNNTPINGKAYLAKEIIKIVKINKELVREKKYYDDIKIYFILLINHKGIVERTIILEKASKGINLIKNKNELLTFMKNEQWKVNSCRENNYHTTILFPINLRLSY
ncbi:hypothetical protein [Flammeovirga kamogawensis]|uniref:TonB C-terminal domain-containing protein n=1 Tax=Flammeovirga kamogawensis TaxID=373891 RepID=A0ABX8H208_9BACT|nr:hypothetical protein [Flammeovirga kamogawensis]MBB6464139.1 hypothetical protein [Flammeovirga kamogawensis]QWG09940.1 hypothetical protein KM029_19860 [Flammeovirga kamogawensis]TRX65449.1 hypothetical protein EO216_23285 [Flammeovirga kamogawensis]